MKLVKYVSGLFLLGILVLIFSFNNSESDNYKKHYLAKINTFIQAQNKLGNTISNSTKITKAEIELIRNEIAHTRLQLKAVDFWLRYLEPLAYKKINSPLPVEWETEVFEKHEKPYKRIGAGLTLAEFYLDEEQINKDTLLHLITESQKATNTFLQDSITNKMKSHDHFYLCNRLFLLNLASIYTTGFECPDTSNVIPELRFMLTQTKELYTVYNQSFPTNPLSDNYFKLFDATIQFVNKSSNNYSHFNHFEFIRDYINPLFILNQQFIINYSVFSSSNLDYALNKTANSIFDKNLYNGQNTKGIFLRVNDETSLQLINDLGKKLFFDPILSVNNERSCASCHKPNEYFTDTAVATSLQLNNKDVLSRNTPSLINVQFNHLSMLDGKFYTLQHQGKAVITNPIEMGSDEVEVVKKVLNVPEYKKGFKKLLKYTPQEKEVTLEHLVSAISFFYGKFGNGYAPFDDAMNKKGTVSQDVIKGFNLFMSKAQCATCHFVPQFNGVKPPFIGSEFEVLGTPQDAHYKALSPDKGRYEINPATETMNAFRTGSLRNIEHTKPYMHNGVFKTLDEVVEFYNGGGGAGRGLKVDNQTLSSDSLKLNVNEKQHLIQFMKALSEKVVLSNQ
ncbi:MAG: hypothetical protein RLZZ175_945 [Bacteroidota bacterium]|jgi:cytochrome c peroxidase